MPEISAGDTAWVLISAALVLLMTVPGLALFYGGMVRAKSTLNMMMMSFGALFVVGIIWVTFGYSMAFGPALDSGSFLGNPGTYFGLNGLLNTSALAINGAYYPIPAGAFIAFHGSTNRAPYPQSSYFIGFVPFKDGKPSGPYEVFADGFAGVDPIVNTRDAQFRPMGIAFAPDGSMYIGETEKGRIWRVQFKGDRDAFGKKELAQMEDRKRLSHIRTPDIVNDRIEPKDLAIGQKIVGKTMR